MFLRFAPQRNNMSRVTPEKLHFIYIEFFISYKSRAINLQWASAVSQKRWSAGEYCSEEINQSIFLFAKHLTNYYHIINALF